MDHQFGKNDTFPLGRFTSFIKSCIFPWKAGEVFCTAKCLSPFKISGVISQMQGVIVPVHAHILNPGIFLFAGCIMKTGKALDPVSNDRQPGALLSQEIPVYLAVDGISLFLIVKSRSLRSCEISFLADLPHGIACGRDEAPSG